MYFGTDDGDDFSSRPGGDLDLRGACLFCTVDSRNVDNAPTGRYTQAPLPSHMRIIHHTKRIATSTLTEGAKDNKSFTHTAWLRGLYFYFPIPFYLDGTRLR